MCSVGTNEYERLEGGRVQAQRIMRRRKACWRRPGEACQAGEGSSEQREQQVG